jgi:hypothetical protein
MADQSNPLHSIREFVNSHPADGFNWQSVEKNDAKLLKMVKKNFDFTVAKYRKPKDVFLENEAGLILHAQYEKHPAKVINLISPKEGRQLTFSTVQNSQGKKRTIMIYGPLTEESKEVLAKNKPRIN